MLNGGLTPVKVVTDILDSSGNVVSEKATKDVAAGIADAATTPSTATVGDASAGSYFRARATMYDGASGTMLKQVVSAPVVVYAADAQPASRLHRLYYSVPAYAALASKPTLQLSGSPMEQGGATATVQAPAGSNVRFIEVIQNTRQVQNGFAQSSFSAHVPMGNRTIIGGQVTSATPNGFYIGRVIDENERVGYTDPIFISASGQIIVPTPTPSPAPAPTPEPAPTPTPSPTPAPTPPPSTPPGNGMQLTATLLSSHYVKMSLTGTAAWALVDVSIRTPDGVTNSARYQADGSGNLTLYQTFSWGLAGDVAFFTNVYGTTLTSAVGLEPTPAPSPTPAPTPPPSTPPGNGMQLTATLLSSHYVKMSLTGTAAWALVDVSIRTPDGVTNSARYQADGSGNLTLYQTFSWGLNGNVVFTTVTNGVTSTSTVTI